MCEGEHGGGTIVCQRGFHLRTKNPVSLAVSYEQGWILIFCAVLQDPFRGC